MSETAPALPGERGLGETAPNQGATAYLEAIRQAVRQSDVVLAAWRAIPPKDRAGVEEPSLTYIKISGSMSVLEERGA